MENTYAPITNIIVEAIECKHTEYADYAFGKASYLNLEVIMIGSGPYAGYVNGTKLCAQANKQFYHWLENKRSKSYVDFLDEMMKRDANKGRKSPLGNPGDSIFECSAHGILRGTYVHPKLIVMIASWCSNEFAYKVSVIVEEHVCREKNKIIQEKECKITQLLAEIRENEKKAQERHDLLMAKYDAQTNELRQVNGHLDSVETHLTNVTVISKETNQQLGNSLKHVTAQRVVPCVNRRRKEVFEMLRLTPTSNSFYVLRRQVCNLRAAMRDLEQRYPEIEVFICCDVPNSRNLFERLKTALGEYVSFKNNIFTLTMPDVFGTRQLRKTVMNVIETDIRRIELAESSGVVSVSDAEVVVDNVEASAAKRVRIDDGDLLIGELSVYKQI